MEDGRWKMGNYFIGIEIFPTGQNWIILALEIHSLALSLNCIVMIILLT
jgi:hypothetical protein